jgi:hypothetical protein
MFTNEEKFKEARRELAYRQFVYSKRVAEGSMKAAQAEKQIALMTEIMEDYLALAEKERLL